MQTSSNPRIPGASGGAPGDQPAAHDDAALGEVDFFSHLGMHIPARAFDGRCDVLRADVPLAQMFFTHPETPVSQSYPGKDSMTGIISIS